MSMVFPGFRKLQTCFQTNRTPFQQAMGQYDGPQAIFDSVVKDLAGRIMGGQELKMVVERIVLDHHRKMPNHTVGEGVVDAWVSDILKTLEKCTRVVGKQTYTYL